MFMLCFVVFLVGQEPAEYPNVNAQLTASFKFANERTAAIEKLVAVAKDAAPVRARANEAAIAFHCLGHMRATEAVPILLDHLEFRPSGPFMSGGVVFYAHQPTAYALCQIGLPSLDPLLKRAADGDKYAELYAPVIVRRVLGLELGKAYLELKLAAEPNPERAARIKKAIDGISKVSDYYLREPGGKLIESPKK
jgi:hypothetical protein